MARYGLQNPFNGDVLIIAALEVTAPVFEGYSGKAVTPGILGCKGPIP